MHRPPSTPWRRTGMQRTGRRRTGRRRTGTVVIAVLAATVGTLGPVGPARAVQGGESVVGDPLVVALVSPLAPTQAFCSGALIQPRIVLTAAHCLYTVANDGSVIPRTYAEGLLVAAPGSDLRAAGVVTVPVIGSGRWRPTTWLPTVTTRDADQVVADDFAVLALQRPLAEASIPLATLAQAEAIKSAGGSVTHLGYGRLDYSTENNGLPYATTHPLLQVRGPIGSSGFLTQATVDRGICPGDSGGPVVATIDGARVLLGVQVGADTSCTTLTGAQLRMAGTLATSFSTLIAAAGRRIADEVAPLSPVASLEGRTVTVTWEVPEAARDVTTDPDRATAMAVVTATSATSGSATTGASAEVCRAAVTAGACTFRSAAGAFGLDVAALTRYGTSTASTLAPLSVAGSVPGKVQRLTAARRTTTWGVTWRAPADDGGLRITRYVITTATGRELCRGTTTGCSFRRSLARPGTLVYVKGRNALGWGRAVAVRLP